MQYVMFGALSGFGAVVMLENPRLGSCMYNLLGFVVVLLGMNSGFQNGKEAVANGASVWLLLGGFAVGFCVFPGAALLATVIRKRRRRPTEG